MKATFDYANLIDRIYAEQLNAAQISTELGISERDWTRRIAGLEEFTQEEISVLTGLLKIDPAEIPEYFFKQI